MEQENKIFNKRKVGRPSGPSGKYVVDGKPVHVYEWRKYVRKKHAEMRLQERIDNPPDIPELIYHVDIQIPVRVLPKIKLIARKNDMSQKEFIWNAIKFYYKHLKQENKIFKNGARK